MGQMLFNYGFEMIDWQTALLSFLLAFLLSGVIAFIYEKTFEGLSYSRGLVQSMVLGSMISCLLMIAIGDNVARGIGIIGSLAIIRFRTNLRDARDLVFLFASLGVGVASGVQSYSTAIIGGLAFCFVAYLLFISPFGTRRKHDGLLRFQIPTDTEAMNLVTSIIQNMTKRFALIAIRDVAQGRAADYAYQIKLHQPEDNLKLVKELEKVDGIRGLTYTSQESTVEV
jgi:uncharacterized membrane protein YhiD involved in acid resistance